MTSQTVTSALLQSPPSCRVTGGVLSPGCKSRTSRWRYISHFIFRYNYNLDLGENYYSHIRDHVATERRDRGDTPGALSFSERMSRRYCGDDRERQMRAKTEAFEREAMREAIRATSEVRREVTPAPIMEARETNYIDFAQQSADRVINKHR